MATPGQWVPPLPAGYEARWDPNQRAYFFINHADKSTTWQDPRFTAQQQHQAAAQSLNPQNLHTTEGHGGQNVAMSTMYKQFGSTTTRDNGSSDDDEWENEEDFDKLFATSAGEEKKVDLKKLHEIKQTFPSASEDLIRSLLEKNDNSPVRTMNDLYHHGYKRVVVSHPEPRRVDMLERLRAMFPNVNAVLVEDMLVTCYNDEKKTRAQLESMGYTATYPTTHRNASAQRERQASPTKPPSPKRETSPAKPKLSDHEKQAVLRKIQNQFKSTEKSVIEMALQVCNYDEARAKKVLERMDTGGGSGTPEDSRPSTSTSRARSPSPTPLPPSILEPVSLFDDNRPSSSTSSLRTSPSGGTTPGVRKSSASRPSTVKATSRPVSPKKTPTTPSHQRQQHRAKHATHRGHGETVVSQQPQARQVYVSQYRTEAKGPDPSHCVGPNKNLLLSEYTSAKGPNPDLRQGPDPSRVQGSQGAMGPDSSLHCGPQLNIRQGPNDANLLITAI